MARLVHIMHQVHRCAMHELYETWQHLVVAQEHLQLMSSMGLIHHDVLYGVNVVSPYISAPPKYHLPEVRGRVPNYGPRRQAHMSVGFSHAQRLEPAEGHVIDIGSPLYLTNLEDCNIPKFCYQNKN